MSKHKGGDGMTEESKAKNFLKSGGIGAMLSTTVKLAAWFSKLDNFLVEA
jgi:hypothetical protein